ncbi:MAG: hypothetical protein E5V99_08130 [Mesorhizobium sp.]|nr:MAG: hypothetical protein E5V99_08130 [Mesorhizobium sp.]
MLSATTIPCFDLWLRSMKSQVATMEAIFDDIAAALGAPPRRLRAGYGAWRYAWLKAASQ